MDRPKFKEEYVIKMINHLKRNNPQNADREYALQMLEVLQEFARSVAKNDPELAEKLLQSFLEEYDQADEDDVE